MEEQLKMVMYFKKFQNLLTHGSEVSANTLSSNRHETRRDGFEMVDGPFLDTWVGRLNILGVDRRLEYTVAEWTRLSLRNRRVHPN